MSLARSCKTLVADVVNALAKERARQNLSMNRLAEMTGLSLTAISYFERGMRNPTFETVARISLALKIDLGLLLQRTVRLRKSADVG